MRYSARERTISLYRMITLSDPFERDEEFTRFNYFGTAFADARAKLINMDVTTKEVDVLERQADRTSTALESQARIVDLAIGDKLVEAQKLFFNETVSAQEKVFTELNELLEIQKKSSANAAAESAAAYNRAQALMLIIGGVSFFLGMFVASVVIRRSNAIEANLFLEKERAQVTLHSIGEGVITTDAFGNIDYLNPVAERLTGWTEEEAKGLPLLDVFSLLDEEGIKPSDSPVNVAIRESRIVSSSSETIINRRNNHGYAIEHTAGPICDHNHETIGAVLVFRNITAIRAMAKQMTYQATHDALTGVINRQEFEERLSLALEGARSDKTQHVLCYIDLDQFKVVNDTCGHQAGDELLKQIVGLMAEHSRKTDTLARLGGDEFGLLIVDTELAQAMEIVGNLLVAIQDFRFGWQDKSFTVGASIGIVEIKPDSGTIVDLLSAADSACFVAKDMGRNRVHVYQPDDKILNQRWGEMQWLPQIREAVEQNQFRLYCQQIVPLGAPANSIQRFEILVRMSREDGVMVPPMAFVPAAERYHLMPYIDRWVIKSALEFLQSYQHCSMHEKQCWAINLSGQSFCDDNFLEFIIDQFRITGVSPELICFEITETAAVSNLSAATDFIAILKDMGCSFALDDFGSGLSSFTYLKNLPVDFLKIDGSFVKDMLHDPIDRAMVKSINQIGHIMGLKTIAEFVEDEKTLNLLRDMEVDFAQGYVVHQPQPLYHLLPISSSKLAGNG